MNLSKVWERLQRVTTLKLSNQQMTGEGSVTVSLEKGALIFHEKGHWSRGIAFTNVYRFTRGETVLHLEHLRFGLSHPVYLLDLVLVEETLLKSTSPHLCGEDRYSCELRVTPDYLELDWTITGPKKDERVIARYS